MDEKNSCPYFKYFLDMIIDVIKSNRSLTAVYLEMNKCSNQHHAAHACQY